MNPCSKCGNEPQLEVDAESTAFLTCPCGRRDLYIFWNNANPLPEIDEVVELADKLAECYELLDEVARSHYAISPLCAELLKKHRGN